jgi:hypothetical protein
VELFLAASSAAAFGVGFATGSAVAFAVVILFVTMGRITLPFSSNISNEHLLMKIVAFSAGALLPHVILDPPVASRIYETSSSDGVSCTQGQEEHISLEGTEDLQLMSSALLTQNARKLFARSAALSSTFIGQPRIP